MTALALTGREWRMTPEGQDSLRNSMQPFIDQMNETHERMQAIFAPALEAHARMRESLAPVIDMQQRILSATSPLSRSIAAAAEAMKSIHESVANVSSLSSTFIGREIVLEPEVFIRREPIVHTTVVHISPKELEDAVVRALERIKPIREVQSTYLLPEGASWENLQVKFIDGHNVKVKYRGMKTRSYNYKEMGFQNNKSNNPDTKWDFFRAIADHGGQLPVENFDSRFNRQAKYELSNRLRTFFGMQQDPFYIYKQNQGYAIKIVVYPDTGRIVEDDFLDASFDS